MIKYIGDLSRQDAEVLRTYTVGARRILEFGAGASTQIFVWASPDDCSVVSVDTNGEWITKQKGLLEQLELRAERVEFLAYRGWHKRVTGKADLIFVDGIPEERRIFALNAWPKLLPGGVMIFHDTRKPNAIGHVCEILKHHYKDVESIKVNERDSNMTTIRRRITPLNYINWNQTERK